MNFYLLDAAAPGLIFGVMIAFMLIIIVIEALMMMLLKYNKAGKAFLDSLLINVVSMAAGFVVLFTNSESLDVVENPYINLLILFVITGIMEFVVLYLLNRQKPIQKTLTTAIAINVVSYLIFYLFQFVF